MSKELDKAVESLSRELEALMQRASEIKKAINQIAVLNGKPAPYNDVESVSMASGIVNLRSDQFYGKQLTTAIKEFLRMHGRAATAKEIFEALKMGGFDFPWEDKFQLKNVAISLSKNRNDFTYIKTNNSFGLWEFYPELKAKREKDRQAKSVDNEREQSDLQVEPEQLIPDAEENGTSINK